MSTFIHGIASSQAIDTAGEVVSLAGMDISSLVGSVFNYEHKSDIPAQIVGKILYAKKIFDESDCDNDAQKKFWQSCQIPYLYVMGELFDDFNESAKEIAGVFMYDSEKKPDQPTLGFSIEGSRISKEGAVVSRSIARKVTCTVAPANKTCLAEAVAPESPNDDLSNIFKTEYVMSSNDLLKAEDAELLLKSDDHPYKKGNVIGKTKSGKEVYSHGPVHAAGFNHEEHAEAAEHHSAAVKASKGNAKLAQHHYDKYKLHMQSHMTQKAKLDRVKGNSSPDTPKPKVQSGSKVNYSSLDPRTNKKSMGKSEITKHPKYGEIHGHLKNANLSMKQAGDIREGGGGDSEVSTYHKQGKANLDRAKKAAGQDWPKFESHFKKSMAKAMTAGSGLGTAPGAKTGTQALAKENLKKGVHDEKGVHAASYETDESEGKNHTGVSMAGAAVRWKEPARAKEFHQKTLKDLKAMPKPKLTKSEALKRAEETYQKWTKREEFEKFMKARMPNMTKGEIIALGQTLVLKKSLDAESVLAELVNYKK